ncbi:hypothetical protein [Streptomyces sp. BH104]|uniref:hypothetical protein n=1 Tax=Streptomyces sp. BH104 TaxID=3410407 RepID=UPI003BB78ED4
MDGAIAEVFTAAGTATAWRHTNIGAIAEVSHGGYTWTVNLPTAGRDGEEEAPARARIIGRFGWGGTEGMSVNATWGQTIPIVDAVMTSRRVL